MSETAGETTAEDTGETGKSDAVEVDTVMAHPVDHVWKVLTTNDGVAALLGSGARLGSKGEPWRAEDGSHGVWRSYHPLEQVRVSWHADADAPRSLVDLHLRPEGDGTRVMLRQEPAGPDSAATRTRWAAALSRLDALA
ncbi:SRPBCC domain-containing protein [Lapillicoccus sp.]|uniref:SRPBCC family protein n=1 Tax=Lapillicoccus sp. TaxID=1909287 RepID=UPI003263CF90